MSICAYHFLPSLVKPLIQHYLFDDELRYDPACFDYLQSNGFLPGTSSDAMDRTYDWPLPWTISFDAPGIKEALELFAHSHPSFCYLIRALGHISIGLSFMHSSPPMVLSCSSQRYPLGPPLWTYLPLRPGYIRFWQNLFRLFIAYSLHVRPRSSDGAYRRSQPPSCYRC